MGQIAIRLLSVVATAAMLAVTVAQPVYCAPELDGKVAASPSDHHTAPSPAAEPEGIKHVALRPPGSSRTAKVAAKKLTPGQRLYKEAGPTATLDPLNWSVMVYKSRHELDVYFDGRFFKKYRAVFGRNLVPSRKEWSEDRQTPEGVYTIIRKYPSARFHWFLKLNYPNLVDRQRYRELRVEHDVPEVDGHILPIGGAIGIHGTDVPVLNAGLVNWTTGCISVDNSAIAELDRLLPVGTIVIINP
jgi:hypothetical protein